MKSAIFDDQNQLDQQDFICTDCGGTFKAIDGTWPKMDMQGNWVITTDDEQPWCLNFYCYDCAP